MYEDKNQGISPYEAKYRNKTSKQQAQRQQQQQQHQQQQRGNCLRHPLDSTF